MKLISTNPSRNYEIIGGVEVSTKEQIKKAIKQARDTFSKWADLPVTKRCELLTSFIKIAEKRSEEIARIITLETGRTIVSARGNVSEGIEYFNAYIEIAGQYLSPKVTLENDAEIHRVYREPWGVIASICPWNYPFENVVWQCGQALIAGNTIVYKNSEENPLFSKLLEEIITDSDLPDGVFNILYGDETLGQQILQQDIDMISFTGSSKVGHLINKIAADKFIPIVMELGGSSPCIIFEDISIDSVMEYISTMRFQNCGQLCDAIKRLIVHKSTFDEVVEKLSKQVAKYNIGDASKEGVDIGPLVAKRQLELIEVQVQDAIEKGAKVIIGGTRPKNLQGAYYLPTILTNISKEMRVWEEETFEPDLPIISFSTEEEAIELANDTEYGLSAHVLTNNQERFDRVAKKLKAGSIAQNKVLYWNPKNPFGGYKKSGMGRVHGEFGFDHFTQIKLVSEEK